MPDNNKKTKTVKPTYDRLKMAKEANNRMMGIDTNTPASKKDSLDYKRGFNVGLHAKLKGKKADSWGKNEFEKMGRWEGQNTTVYVKNNKKK